MHELNIEANVQLFYDSWNRGDTSTMMPMFAPNAIDHNYVTGVGRSEDLMGALVALRKAFPDLKFKVLELAVDSKRQIATYNLECEGTHQSAYYDFPPSGKIVKWREMRMSRWHEGRVAEHWTVSEVFAILCAQQRSDSVGS